MHAVQSAPVTLCPPGIPEFGQGGQMASIRRQGEICIQAVCEPLDLAGSRVQPDQVSCHRLPCQIIAHFCGCHRIPAPGCFPQGDTGPARGHAYDCFWRLGPLRQRRIDEFMIRDPDRLMSSEPGQRGHRRRTAKAPGRQFIDDQAGPALMAFDQDQEGPVRRQALQIGMRLRIQARQWLRRRL